MRRTAPRRNCWRAAGHMQDSVDDLAEPERSLRRQLAHELRNALSPLASAVDLARLRGFDAEASRLLAEKVERALHRAQLILDRFVVAEPGGAAVEAQHDSARQPSTGEPRSSAAAGPEGASRILIVDDSVEVRRTYREALVALGYAVTEAADAEQALSVVESDPPDVALIDVHLQGTNGFRLVQSIRGRSGGSIRLVMFSGMAVDTATEHLAREAGFDDCLDKMAGPIALRDLIESW